MNIKEKTIINARTERTGVTEAEVRKYFKRENLGLPNYEYFGKRVSRGTINLRIPGSHPHKCYFHETNGWVDEVTVLN